MSETFLRLLQRGVYSNEYWKFPQERLQGICRKVWNMQPMRSLAMPLEPPVHLLRMDSLPKLVAGGVPVLPINLVLARKRQFQFTPDTTLSSLVHAAQYYVEF